MSKAVDEALARLDNWADYGYSQRVIGRHVGLTGQTIHQCMKTRRMSSRSAERILSAPDTICEPVKDLSARLAEEYRWYASFTSDDTAVWWLARAYGVSDVENLAKRLYDMGFVHLKPSQFQRRVVKERVT